MEDTAFPGFMAEVSRVTGDPLFWVYLSAPPAPNTVLVDETGGANDQYIVLYSAVRLKPIYLHDLAQALDAGKGKAHVLSNTGWIVVKDGPKGPAAK
jgi:hypothetical protein